jgi:allantoinase
VALDEAHLQYPRRAYGMDHDLYKWRVPSSRLRLNWPAGKTLACIVVVPIEHHMLNPAGAPYKHPGAMVTPYPDLRHYTSRDYGNRVGIFRILKALKSAGVVATFPINAALLERFRPIVDAVLEDGHEIAAYGLSTDHIHWGGLDRGIEESWVVEVRRLFEKAGLAPRTWMSPARQQSFCTLELIAKSGFDICLDWEQDTVPILMQTTANHVMALPLSNELDDRTLLIDRRQSEDDWTCQILAAIEYMKSEFPRSGGQSLGFTLTPYVSGQPFRIAAARRMLSAIGNDPAVWCASTSQLVGAISYCSALTSQG